LSQKASVFPACPSVTGLAVALCLFTDE
jgi:hypothetical protein